MDAPGTNRFALTPVDGGPPDEAMPPGPEGGPSVHGPWETDFTCGHCDAVVGQGLSAGLFVGYVFQCGRCGLYSVVRAGASAACPDTDGERKARPVG